MSQWSLHTIFWKENQHASVSLTDHETVMGIMATSLSCYSCYEDKLTFFYNMWGGGIESQTSRLLVQVHAS